MKVYSSFNPRSHKSFYKKNNKRRNPLLYVFIFLTLAALGFVWWAIATDPGASSDPVDLTETTQEPSQLARVVYLKGILQQINGEETQQLNIDGTIQPGATLQAGAESRAIIKFPDDSLVRLDAGAEIRLVDFSLADVVIEHLRGQTFHRVNDQSPAIYRVQNTRIELTALGTAFNVEGQTNLKVTVTESRVKAKVYENAEHQNIVNMRTIEQGQRADINPDLSENDAINSTAVESTSLLDNDWFVWNKTEDEENGFFLGIFEKAIDLTITEPAETEFTADSDTITVKGTTDPEAEIFIFGQEVENQDGSFAKEITLESGENTIEIVVQKGQNKNKKVLYVTLRGDVDENLVLTSAKEDQTALLVWTYDGEDTVSGFRVVQSLEPQPTYPEATYHTINADTFQDSWPDLAPGTYHFRVCLFHNNTCTSYSNEVVVSITENEDDQTSSEDSSINLQAKQVGSDIQLSWNVTALGNTDGFKTVVDTNANPTYPTHSSHSLDANSRGDLWKGLEPGSYHFRVCAVQNNECTTYSNDTQVTLDEKPSQTGAITLTGSSSDGEVTLKYTTSGFSAPTGFHVMAASSTSVDLSTSIKTMYFPQPHASTAIFQDLEIGQTYYFRVCSNNEGACEISSNVLSLTVQ